MKKFAIGLLATTVLALAAPAVAQDRIGLGGGYGGGYNGGGYGGGGSYGGGYGYGYSQNWERGGRVGFREEFNHVYAGIQHGLRDGSYTQWEARQFIREVEGLRRLERLYRANDGRLNGWERRDLQQRLERLHGIMHVAHQRGHRRDDRGGYGGDRYGRDGGGYGRDGWRDPRDDDDDDDGDRDGYHRPH